MRHSHDLPILKYFYLTHPNVMICCKDGYRFLFRYFQIAYIIMCCRSKEILIINNVDVNFSLLSLLVNSIKLGFNMVTYFSWGKFQKISNSFDLPPMRTYTKVAFIQQQPSITPALDPFEIIKLSFNMVTVSLARECRCGWLLQYKCKSCIYTATAIYTCIWHICK